MLLGYYSKWVNGAGLPTIRAAYDAAPRRAPLMHASPAPGPPLSGIPLGPPPAGMGPLPRLKRERLAPVRHVILHGSQATGDACAFSDVDIAVVLDDSRPFTLGEHRGAVRELKRVLRAIYRYDCLMHHGLMFVVQSDLQRYDQSFLPLETFRRACALHGPAMLSVRTVEPDGQKAKERLRRAVAVMREQAEAEFWQRNDFALKRFISNVLLIPALVAAARGRYVYKKDSFEVAREWFTALDWTGIARAEEFRALWARPPAPLLSRLASHGPHPCLQIRSVLRYPPRVNAERFLRDHAGLWRQELRRVFARAEELAC
jgi:hypothetical protein